MRFRTLVCCSLFAFAANGQSKEAEFKKLETLFRKSIGITALGHKILNYSVSEKEIKLDVSSEGKSYSVITNKLNWDGFTYSAKALKDDAKVSEVSIAFDKDIELQMFENKKLVDKQEEDQIRIYVNANDAKEIERQFEELQSYTWKGLAELRNATREKLVSFITKTINTAISGDKGKVTMVDDCAITITYADREISLPTRDVKVHGDKELISEYYLFCYGKPGKPVGVKKGGSQQTKTLEHPDVELDFEENETAQWELPFAIKRLASTCTK